MPSAARALKEECSNQCTNTNTNKFVKVTFRRFWPLVRTLLQDVRGCEKSHKHPSTACRPRIGGHLFGYYFSLSGLGNTPGQASNSPSTCLLKVACLDLRRQHQYDANQISSYMSPTECPFEYNDITHMSLKCIEVVWRR